MEDFHDLLLFARTRPGKGVMITKRRYLELPVKVQEMWTVVAERDSGKCSWMIISALDEELREPFRLTP